MDAPTSLHKITIFAQLLKKLENKADALQVKIIKAAREEHLRLMLLNRYPLRLPQMPATMPAPVQELGKLLPEVKRIIETTADEQAAIDEVMNMLEYWHSLAQIHPGQ